MSLSDQRRFLRYQSLTTAAAMIAEQLELGASPDELGMTDEEYDIYAEENTRTHNVLMKIAEKLMKDHRYLIDDLESEND